MWKIKRKDGTYLQERVTDELTGESRIISVKIRDESRAAVKAAKEKLEKKLSAGKPSRAKLSDLFEMYENEQRKTVKESSFVEYYSLDRLIIETVGDIYLTRLSAGLLKKNLLDSGKSTSTLNRYIARLKSCLKWAYLNDLIPESSVYDKLVLFPETPVRVRIQDKFLEPFELNRLISETSPSLSLCIRFLALSGMRIGEMIALDNSDIWGDEIHITKTFSSHSHKISTPKTASSLREIHIQPELAACILDVRAFMHNQQRSLGYPPRPYLFCNNQGNRLNYDTVEERLRNSGKQILNRDITCHILRHTHASMLAASGYPLEAISRRLGHEGCEVTKAIYIHQTEKMKARDAAALDNIVMLNASNY